MKVQAALNLGTSEYPEHALKAGEISDVPDKVGALMLARGHAVEIKPEPPVKAQEVPAKSESVADEPQSDREKPKQKPTSK